MLNATAFQIVCIVDSSLNAVDLSIESMMYYAV